MPKIVSQLHAILVRRHPARGIVVRRAHGQGPSWFQDRVWSRFYAQAMERQTARSLGLLCLSVIPLIAAMFSGQVMWLILFGVLAVGSLFVFICEEIGNGLGLLSRRHGGLYARLEREVITGFSGHERLHYEFHMRGHAP